VKEKLIQKKDELKILQAKSADGGAKDPAQDELLVLQAEYDDRKKQVKENEAKLLMDVETVTKDTLHRLEKILNENTDSKQLEGAPEKDQEDNNPSSKKEANSGNQLSRLLLKEMKAEIEVVWSVARIRFGREVDTLNQNGLSTIKNGSEVTTASTLPVEDPVHRRDALERDIQAAVAEEDYDTAGMLLPSMGRHFFWVTI